MNLKWTPWLVPQNDPFPPTTHTNNFDWIQIRTVFIDSAQLEHYTEGSETYKGDRNRGDTKFIHGLTMIDINLAVQEENVFIHEERYVLRTLYDKGPRVPFKAQWLLYVPPSLTFSNSTFCPHSVFMCFVWIWEQTAIISLYSINWLVFITETECVYCAVRTGSLYIILRSAHTVNLCVLCGSENKQRLFPYTALTDWFV